MVLLALMAVAISSGHQPARAQATPVSTCFSVKSKTTNRYALKVSTRRATSRTFLPRFSTSTPASPRARKNRLRRIMAREYRTGQAGLPGNDDAGTMSSWYVWNAVGLYPNAGQDFYYIDSPLFTSAAIDLDGGRTFTIEAPNASEANKYVNRSTLDGRLLDRAWLTHSEISRGGKLVLQMSEQPSSWGSTNRPPSMSKPSTSGVN